MCKIRPPPGVLMMSPAGAPELPKAHSRGACVHCAPLSTPELGKSQGSPCHHRRQAQSSVPGSLSSRGKDCLGGLGPLLPTRGAWPHLQSQISLLLPQRHLRTPAPHGRAQPFPRPLLPLPLPAPAQRSRFRSPTLPQFDLACQLLPSGEGPSECSCSVRTDGEFGQNDEYRVSLHDASPGKNRSYTVFPAYRPSLHSESRWAWAGQEGHPVSWRPSRAGAPEEPPPAASRLSICTPRPLRGLPKCRPSSAWMLRGGSEPSSRGTPPRTYLGKAALFQHLGAATTEALPAPLCFSRRSPGPGGGEGGAGQGNGQCREDSLLCLLEQSPVCQAQFHPEPSAGCLSATRVAQETSTIRVGHPGVVLL